MVYLVLNVKIVLMHVRDTSARVHCLSFESFGSSALEFSVSVERLF